MKVKSESEAVQSCPTLSDPMDRSLPGSSVHGIFQARVLEWVAISSSRESSQPRDGTCASCIGKRILYCCTSSLNSAKELKKVLQAHLHFSNRTGSLGLIYYLCYCYFSSLITVFCFCILLFSPKPQRANKFSHFSISPSNEYSDFL